MANAITVYAFENVVLTDQQLIALWMHPKTGRRPKSPHTIRAYMSDVKALLSFFDGKPLAKVTLYDLLAFADSLTGSENSKKRTLCAVKSLFSFAHKLGFLSSNPAAAVSVPSPKNTLAERILSEEEVHAIIGNAKEGRNRVLIRLLYASGGRVSEICSLRWGDVKQRGDAGQITLYGKNDKTRAVVLSVATWKALQSIRGNATSHDAVFRSRKGGRTLGPARAWRIVRDAARAAGVHGNVSPHWFRHSHASHALDRGASAALVRDTLGHSSLAITSLYAHSMPGDSSALHLGV
jgi:integrase/recombinase XerD